MRAYVMRALDDRLVVVAGTRHTFSAATRRIFDVFVDASGHERFFVSPSDAAFRALALLADNEQGWILCREEWLDSCRQAS